MKHYLIIMLTTTIPLSAMRTQPIKKVCASATETTSTNPSLNTDLIQYYAEINLPNKNVLETRFKQELGINFPFAKTQVIPKLQQKKLRLKDIDTIVEEEIRQYLNNQSLEKSPHLEEIVKKNKNHTMLVLLKDYPIYQEIYNNKKI